MNFFGLARPKNAACFGPRTKKCCAFLSYPSCFGLACCCDWLSSGYPHASSLDTRGSHYHKFCITICDRDQNGIKQSRLPFEMNQTIKKVLNLAIKHLTKVTCKQNDNLQRFPGFPVSTSSNQDMKSSYQSTFLS